MGNEELVPMAPSSHQKWTCLFEFRSANTRIELLAPEPYNLYNLEGIQHLYELEGCAGHMLVGVMHQWQHLHGTDIGLKPNQTQSPITCPYVSHGRNRAHG